MPSLTPNERALLDRGHHDALIAELRTKHRFSDLGWVYAQIWEFKAACEAYLEGAHYVEAIDAAVLANSQTLLRATVEQLPWSSIPATMQQIIVRKLQSTGIEPPFSTAPPPLATTIESNVSWRSDLAKMQAQYLQHPTPELALSIQQKLYAQGYAKLGQFWASTPSGQLPEPPAPRYRLGPALCTPYQGLHFTLESDSSDSHLIHFLRPPLDAYAACAVPSAIAQSFLLKLAGLPSSTANTLCAVQGVFPDEQAWIYALPTGATWNTLQQSLSISRDSDLALRWLWQVCETLIALHHQDIFYASFALHSLWIDNNLWPRLFIPGVATLARDPHSFHLAPERQATPATPPTPQSESYELAQAFCALLFSANTLPDALPEPWRSYLAPALVEDPAQRSDIQALHAALRPHIAGLSPLSKDDFTPSAAPANPFGLTETFDPIACC